MTPSRSSDSDTVLVIFTADIKLDAAEIDAADGDYAQAVQNRIGHTGAVVMDVEHPEWSPGR